MKQKVSDDSVSFTLNRLELIDLQLLHFILKRGPTHYHKLKGELGERTGEVLARCKARGLIVAVQKSEHYYVYDVTDLGLAVLRSKRMCEGAPGPTPTAGTPNV